jgi:hypothetical protein
MSYLRVGCILAGVLTALLSAVTACRAGIPAEGNGHFENDQFAFDYPAGWQTLDAIWGDRFTPASENELGAREINGVADPATSTPWERYSVYCEVAVRELPAGRTLEEVYHEAYLTSPAAIEQVISETTLTVDGVTAYEYIYTQFWGEPLWQRRDVWLEKNGVIYILTCKALPNRFEERQADFDLIVNSFHVK